MSPQSLSSFSTRCYRHLLICKNDEVKLCRMRMTDHPRSRSWCCLRPRRHSKDSGSEETGSLGSEAAPRRDEHFGSQCLAEIRCFLMSRSRQARRDSKNAFLLRSSAGARLRVQIFLPVKMPLKSCLHSTSKFFLFAAVCSVSTALYN